MDLAATNGMTEDFIKANSKKTKLMAMAHVRGWMEGSIMVSGKTIRWKE